MELKHNICLLSASADNPVAIEVTYGVLHWEAGTATGSLAPGEFAEFVWPVTLSADGRAEYTARWEANHPDGTESETPPLPPEAYAIPEGGDADAPVD